VSTVVGSYLMFVCILKKRGILLFLRYITILHRACECSINPLRPKLVKIIFNNSVRTAKKTQHFTITKINWLMLSEEIIAVEKHTKPIDTK
jgi:hypothetical protein